MALRLEQGGIERITRLLYQSTRGEALDLGVPLSLLPWEKKGPVALSCDGKLRGRRWQNNKLRYPLTLPLQGQWAPPSPKGEGKIGMGG